MNASNALFRMIGFESPYLIASLLWLHDALVVVSNSVVLSLLLF